jgi:hypothetical protein
MNSGHNVYHPGIQIRIRSLENINGYQKMVSVQSLLEGIRNESVVVKGTAYTILNVSQASSILPMGIDEDRLHQFSLNFLVSIRKEE